MKQFCGLLGRIIPNYFVNIVGMIIFAVGNNNNNNNKDSNLLAYMQIRQDPSGTRKSGITELGSPGSAIRSEVAGSVISEISSIQKVPIAATLRKLSIGESVEFPIEQRTSLLVTANRLKRELSRIGWDYEYRDDEENFLVIFTRKN